MALSEEYFNKRIEEKRLQAQPVAPAQGTQPSYDTAPAPAVAPQQDAEYQKRESEAGILKRWPAEYVRSLREHGGEVEPDSPTTEKLDYAIIHGEGRREYLLGGIVYDMPEESVWNDMSEWEKQKFYTVENTKKTWGLLKKTPGFIGKLAWGIPKQFARSFFSIEQSVYDIKSETLEKTRIAYDELVSKILTVNPEIKMPLSASIAQDLLSKYKDDERGRSYDLPVLGKVEGIGTYHDYATDVLKLGPLGASYYATTKFAGDLAMAGAAISAVRNLVKGFFTDLKFVKPKGAPSVVGPDWRPMVQTSLQQLKTKVAAGLGIKPKPGALTTPGPITGPVTTAVKGYKQDPGVVYQQVLSPKSKLFSQGDNSKWFWRASPNGIGKMEVTLVKAVGTISSKVRDFLTKKFGRANVIAGKTGTEVKIASSPMTYDPALATATAKGSTFAAVARMGKDIAPVAAATAPAAAGAKPVPAGIQQSITEAKAKGLSAEEFVEGQEKVFRGSTIEDLKKPINEGVSFTTDKNVADEFAKDRNGEVKTLFLDRNIKLAKEGDLVDVYNNLDIDLITSTDKEIQASVIRGLKEDNFDGIDFRNISLETLEETDTPGFNVYQSDKEIFIFNSNRIKTKSQLADLYNQPTQPVPTPVEGAPPEVPSIMQSPKKGWGDKVGSEKQVGQVSHLADMRGLGENGVKQVSLTLNGKENIYDLTQDELFEVSEAIKAFAQPTTKVAEYDFDTKISLSSRFLMSRTWMGKKELQAAEQGLNYPIDSEIRVPIEMGIRVARNFRGGWFSEFDNALGVYANPNKYIEERRLISAYTEGDTGSILNNESLTPTVKKELSEAGDWFNNYFRESWDSRVLGMSYTEYYNNYLPKLRKRAGAHLRYKGDEMTPELSVFAQFHREKGQLDVLEDDILVLAQAYASAVSKIKYLKKPYDHAQEVLGTLPENLKIATTKWVEEVTGQVGEVEKGLAKAGEKLSKRTKGLIPANIFSESIKNAMQFSYGRGMGLPRVANLVRNLTGQSHIFQFAEFGAKYYLAGFKTPLLQKIENLRAKGFQVEKGVYYGAELSEAGERGIIGKGLDLYGKLNMAMLTPYAFTDLMNRAETLDRVNIRFEDWWYPFRDGKISLEHFEREIDMQGFSPTVQKVIRQKLNEDTNESLIYAQDLMAKEIIDRMQFPYRKGGMGSMHYGVGGKALGQFSQYTWGYTTMIGDWIKRGQWDKLIRLLGMGEATKRSFAEAAGIDISKWIGMGPINIPVSPAVRIAALATQGIESALDGFDKELNNAYNEIMRSIKLFGGVGMVAFKGSRLKKVEQSVDIYEKTMSGVSPFPLPVDPSNPDRKFGLWTVPIAKGAISSLIRPVTFGELLKYGGGFEDINGKKHFDALNVTAKGLAEKRIAEKRAMKFLQDGKLDEYNDFYIANQLDFNPGDRMDSQTKSILERRYNNYSYSDKIKYYNLVMPILFGDEFQSE